MGCYSDFVALRDEDLTAADLQARLRDCPQVVSRNWYHEPLEELEVALLGDDATPILERDVVPVGSPDDGCVLVPLLPAMRDAMASELPDDVQRVAAFFEERDISNHGKELIALARQAKADGRALYVYLYGY